MSEKAKPWIAMGFVALIAFMAYRCGPDSTGPGKPARSPAATASPAGPTCNRQWTGEVTAKAQASPMIRDLAMRPDGLHIVVNEAAWTILKLNERDRLVSAFDCEIAGPGYLKAIIVETPRGVTLKTYTAVELLHARRLQP